MFNKSYVTKRLIARIGLGLLGVASLLIGIITFYGQNAGNFVIDIDDEAYSRGIALSSDSNFLSPQPRLLSDALFNVHDMTYGWLQIENVTKSDGNFVDPNADHQYIAYTFYLRNIGTETCNLNMRMDIVNLEKEVDKAVRVLIIKEDGTRTMYMHKDDEVVEYVDMPEAELFYDDLIVMSEPINNFRPTQTNRYSILIWVEGQDPDCNDSILGGKIKFRLTFSITSASDEPEIEE